MIRSKLKIAVVVLALAAVVAVVVVALRVGAPPQIVIEPGLPAIGPRTPVRVELSEPGRGLSTVRVFLVQGETRKLLAEEQHRPRPAWSFWGEATAHTELQVDIGRETVPELQEGQATIRVEAERAPSALRSPTPAVVETTLPVKLRPPQLQERSQNVRVRQGGAEVVVYRVGEDSVRDGVQAGDWWFPGYDLPGGQPGDRFALFAAPYDLEQPDRIRLVAADQLGNRVEVPFVDAFQARRIRADTIRLSDGFMERVVPPILAQNPQLSDRGNLLDNYLMINGELRAANAETLRELARDSEPAFLWRGAFLPMRNAKVMSNYADRRTYLYEGREVDHQDHLGFDLASVRHAELQAGNAGRVVLARDFGIYGNAVVIDHGYGLASLYGHLSQIDVAQGDRVERGQRIGLSGQTGLAGGDHLHFTMLLHGHATDPQEWWDAHWIHDRLKLKLGEALP